MNSPFLHPLDPVRTDGWFERVGQTVPSFHALCEIMGERFFAFSLITGVRISALTVDRRNPQNTLVEFSVEGDEGASTEQVSLPEFQNRLVSALVMPSPPGAVPGPNADSEVLQNYIGAHYLLLAPLYGWSVRALAIQPRVDPQLTYAAGAVEYTLPLEEFREALREQVEAELQYACDPNEGASLDLGHVAEAEQLFAAQDYEGVRTLLATWPATLTILLRTPEAQAVPDETRARLAHALGLLGSSCSALGDSTQAEEVFRLAVQYAGEGPVGAQVYERLGLSLLAEGRIAEGIAPLRRAVALGSADAWAHLAGAFLSRGRLLAAWGAAVEARRAGQEGEALADVMRQVSARLGEPMGSWQALVGSLDGASAVAS